MGERNLYNAFDGVAGRDGGPYLDQVEAREAERRRAAVEGREPDLDNPPATAGQPLVTAEQLVRLQGTSNIPSQEAHNVQADVLDKFAKDDVFPIKPHSTRETTSEEDALAEDSHLNNPANSTLVSNDADGDGVPDKDAEVPASDAPTFPDEVQ